jgi:hypothetical protein
LGGQNRGRVAERSEDALSGQTQTARSARKSFANAPGVTFSGCTTFTSSGRNTIMGFTLVTHRICEGDSDSTRKAMHSRHHTAGRGNLFESGRCTRPRTIPQEWFWSAFSEDATKKLFVRKGPGVTASQSLYAEESVGLKFAIAPSQSPARETRTLPKRNSIFFCDRPFRRTYCGDRDASDSFPLPVLAMKCAGFHRDVRR